MSARAGGMADPAPVGGAVFCFGVRRPGLAVPRGGEHGAE
jgi:hypothetical protein